MSIPFLKNILNEWKNYQDQAKPTPDPPKPAPDPTPIPKPIPVPEPIIPGPEPKPEPVKPPEPITGPIAIWDGSLIPDQMRQFVTGSWSDNQLFWALFTCYGSHVGDFSQDAAALGAQCQTIREWFTNGTRDLGNQLKANPNLKAVIIANDANDRGGLFMVDNIRNQLQQMGVNPSQLEDGQVYRP